MLAVASSRVPSTAATASASSVPPASRVIPSVSLPNLAVTEAIQSSGRSWCPDAPRSRSIRPSPR